MAYKSETALKQAIEMEEEGKQFYLQSAAKVKSALAKAIFQDLAVAEDYHIVAIKEIYDKMVSGKPLKEWITETHAPRNIEKVFKESLIDKAKASQDDLDALRFGVEREEKSIAYYEALAGETGSPFEKRFYMTLSYEERGHYLGLVDAIQFLKDPAGWYYVSERDMVDGG